VKNWQSILIRKAATEARKRLEKSDKEELLNLFNSGIVVDLKRVKIKAIELLLKVQENSDKRKGK
jgi:hypothetical protein